MPSKDWITTGIIIRIVTHCNCHCCSIMTRLNMPSTYHDPFTSLNVHNIIKEHWVHVDTTKDSVILPNTVGILNSGYGMMRSQFQTFSNNLNSRISLDFQQARINNNQRMAAHIFMRTVVFFSVLQLLVVVVEPDIFKSSFTFLSSSSIAII